MQLAEVRARIAVLQEEEKALKAQEQRELDAKRASVQRKYRFMLTPLDKPFNDGYNKVMDPSITAWHLSGKVLNEEECLAAGHSRDEVVGTKGMTYLFNTLSGKFVMATGGGTHFVDANPWHSNGDPVKKQEKIADGDAAFSLLGDFIKDNPKGGDVTHIVAAQRHCNYR